MSSSLFDEYGRYYDLLYSDKNYSAEVDYVDRVLRGCGVNGGELLEFGSGTGKHGVLLAQRGYRVLGIERSAEMVARAPSGLGFESRVGDVRSVHLQRTFDAVLSLFHVVSYQTTNFDVAAVFARAVEHLRPNGVFLFDVWYSPAVYAQRPVVRIKRLAQNDVVFTRLAEPVMRSSENVVDVNYTVIAHDMRGGSCRQFTETHPMRHFSLPELDLFADAAGLQRVCAEEFGTGAAPDEGTWGVCVVMRKVE